MEGDSSSVATVSVANELAQDDTVLSDVSSSNVRLRNVLMRTWRMVWRVDKSVMANAHVEPKKDELQ
jgi:hypothetical protein